MKIALGADEDLDLITAIARYLDDNGHAVTRFGAVANETEPWARTGVRVAESVASGQHDIGIWRTHSVIANEGHCEHRSAVVKIIIRFVTELAQDRSILNHCFLNTVGRDG